MVYVFPVRISDVFERKLRKHVSGAGAEAIFTTDNAGWYLQIEGLATIYVGEEQPIIQPGERMELVLRKPERSQKNASTSGQ